MQLKIAVLIWGAEIGPQKQQILNLIVTSSDGGEGVHGMQT